MLFASSAPLKELVEEYEKRGAWAKVRTYGEMALDIFPSDADLLMTLGKAYLATGDADRSLYSYDSALVVDPPLRRPALAHIGRTRAFLAKGDKKALKEDQPSQEQIAFAALVLLVPGGKDALRRALTWYCERHPAWFSWLELA